MEKNMKTLIKGFLISLAMGILLNFIVYFARQNTHQTLQLILTLVESILIGVTGMAAAILWFHL